MADLDELLRRLDHDTERLERAIEAAERRILEDWRDQREEDRD